MVLSVANADLFGVLCMRIKHRANFRRLALALVFLILGGAVAPANEWRCTDGRICPNGGPASHQRSAARQQSGAAASCCHPVALRSNSDANSLSSGMQCVLTFADHACASLSRLQTATDHHESPVLPPAFTISVCATQTADWVVFTADLPPPPEPSARSGRSPPVPLS